MIKIQREVADEINPLCRAARVGALAVLALVAVSCGDDPAGAPDSSVARQMPAPMGMPAPAPPAAPDSTPPASTPPGSTEAPMGMVALQPQPPAASGSGNSGTGETPPATTPAAETPPAEPAAETPAAEPEPQPEPPPAFAPCPTDGSACRIMPLGDSITDGVGSANPDGGYRVELFRQAVRDGHEVTFVGRQTNGPNTVDNQPFPRNHEGYSGATIASGGNQIANRLDGALAANPPHIVLLQIGTNDVYQGMPATLPGQLGSLLDRINAAVPNALVVVAQITPMARTGAQFNFPNNGSDVYNAAIPAVLQQRVDAGQHLLLVNMTAAFAAANANPLSLLAEGLHPNNSGYAVMAQTWYSAIEDFLP
ncbi:MAG TPA: SGNH/GDSL hydrolase family protein [Polyangiaceae bacterium]|nr:SGNH/GDSL hydrolase family protein [Polyangiaceae bacterium]